MPRTPPARDGRDRDSRGAKRAGMDSGYEPGPVTGVGDPPAHHERSRSPSIERKRAADGSSQILSEAGILSEVHKKGGESSGDGSPPRDGQGSQAPSETSAESEGTTILVSEPTTIPVPDEESDTESSRAPIGSQGDNETRAERLVLPENRVYMRRVAPDMVDVSTDPVLFLPQQSEARANYKIYSQPGSPDLVFVDRNTLNQCVFRDSRLIVSRRAARQIDGRHLDPRAELYLGLLESLPEAMSPDVLIRDAAGAVYSTRDFVAVPQRVVDAAVTLSLYEVVRARGYRGLNDIYEDPNEMTRPLFRDALYELVIGREQASTDYPTRYVLENNAVVKRKILTHLSRLPPRGTPAGEWTSERHEMLQRDTFKELRRRDREKTRWLFDNL